MVKYDTGELDYSKSQKAFTQVADVITGHEMDRTSVWLDPSPRLPSPLALHLGNKGGFNTGIINSQFLLCKETDLEAITEGMHTILVCSKRPQRRQFKPVHEANLLESMGEIQHWSVLDLRQ